MVGETPEVSTRRKNGQFDGYRVNREVVPCLPASIVCECLSDPRRVPYLLMWKHRGSGVLKEVVRLASPYPTHDWLEMGWAEVKRGDGSKVSIRLIQRAHKSMLICNSCQKPRLALYGWETNAGPRNVSLAPWLCRACAGLSYASEGQALLIRRLFPDLKPFSQLMQKPNPGPWDPLVFVSPWAAVDIGLVSRSSEMPDENLELKNPREEATAVAGETS
jgi:hypothetical protein